MTDHPAKFSDPIIVVINDLLHDEYDRIGHAPLVLDPFAGVGGIEQIWPKTVGVELELEWAMQGQRVMVGDALKLPFASGSVDCVATSPVFGNRMSDHHNAQEKCRSCFGTGKVKATPWHPDDGEFDRCEKCDGMGKREYDRITYKHKLGRMPSEGSSAVLQWGTAYKKFHHHAWREAYRVLRDDGLFVLNIGDHIRNHKRQSVSAWHAKDLQRQGLTLERRIKVPVRKMRKGANREARVPYEWVLTFRKVA